MGVIEGVTKKIWETKLRLQLNNLTQKLDFDVCGLGLEEEHTRWEYIPGTRFRKKKKEQKKQK